MSPVEALDLAITALERQWSDIDRERKSIPYPEDQPFIESQQKLEQATETLHDLREWHLGGEEG